MKSIGLFLGGPMTWEALFFDSPHPTGAVMGVAVKSVNRAARKQEHSR